MSEKNDISIEIEIGSRKYPLTVGIEEEKIVKAAANKINETIRFLQESYAIRDSQDLIAMATLQLVTKNLTEESNNTQEQKPVVNTEINTELESLDRYLNDVLKG